MVSIVKATIKDVETIIEIARVSFVESHHTSTTKEIMDGYITKSFTIEGIKDELSDPNNLFHIIYYDNQVAGFSKIALNSGHTNIDLGKITKLERIYLLEEFHSLKLGYQLFQFNVELSKTNNQNGMWLFVWDQNAKAIRFYEKTGFKIIGRHDFFLSEDHSNPNHQMLLTY